MKTRKADKEFEELICQACGEYAEAVPGPNDFPGHKFSPAFETRMAALAKHAKRRTSIRCFAQRAAAVFVAVVVSMGAWLGVDGEARADFASWLRESYESSVLYSFKTENIGSALPDVELGWLPEGYELVMEEKDDTRGYLIYEDEQGGSISFLYFLSNSESKLSLEFGNTEYEYKSLSINGMNADLYISSDPLETNCLIWFDEERGITFSLSSFEESHIIVHIAEKIKTAE